MLEMVLPSALGGLLPLDPQGYPRVYPDQAPMETPLPYIVFTAVGGQPVSTLAGDNPINVRMQFNVWSESRLEANDLMAKIGKIVTAEPFRAVSQGMPVVDHDDRTKDYGARQDFSFWLQPRTPAP